MAFATLNGNAVYEAQIYMPIKGVWTFDAMVDTQDASQLSGSLTLATTDGQLTLKGTSYRGGVAYDTGLVRGVLGKGGMQTKATPRSYRNAPLSVVANDLLRGVGESLAPGSDIGTLNTLLPHWSVMAQPTGAALSQLLAGSGATWRTQADGTILVVKDAYFGSYNPVITEDDRPHVGDFWVAFESLNFSPGSTFQGRRVNYVEHFISAEGIRSRLTTG